MNIIYYDLNIEFVKKSIKHSMKFNKMLSRYQENSTYFKNLKVGQKYESIIPKLDLNLNLNFI